MTTAKNSGKKSPANSPNRTRKTPGTVEPTPKKNKKKQIKKTEEPKKKMGRPPVKYDPERHPEWVRGLASRGATIPEICTAMKVSRGTLYAWRDTYPDFIAALQVGRSETAARIVNAMVKKAQGFTYQPPDEVKITENPDGSRTVQTIKKEIYFPPDTGAAKMIMVNLDPAFKTDRTQSELTGAGGAPLESTIIILPDNGRDKAPSKKSN